MLTKLRTGLDVAAQGLLDRFGDAHRDSTSAQDRPYVRIVPIICPGIAKEQRETTTVAPRSVAAPLRAPRPTRTSLATASGHVFRHL